MRGYSAIGLYHPKSAENVGSVLRAAQCYGAAIVIQAGNRTGPGCTDTMKAYRSIPYLKVEDLHAAIPHDCVPVAVDLVPGARDLRRYIHPERAFYIFGPEDGTLGENVLSWCRDKIMVPTARCMNLAATVNVILYDRLAKQEEN
jgi:tRNA(Leu) C34 or U34 (ribose-2'-O)-methylase TrmL